MKMTAEEAGWIVDWMERAHKEADALYELAKKADKKAAMGYSHRLSSMISASLNTARAAIDRPARRVRGGSQ